MPKSASSCRIGRAIAFDKENCVENRYCQSFFGVRMQSDFHFIRARLGEEHPPSRRFGVPRATAWQASRNHFAMQMFFGSVKKSQRFLAPKAFGAD